MAVFSEEFIDFVLSVGLDLALRVFVIPQIFGDKVIVVAGQMMPDVGTGRQGGVLVR